MTFKDIGFFFVAFALRHVPRGLVILLEILGLLALCALIGWGALLWRLMQGPIDLEPVAARIEAAFNKESPEFNLSIGPAELRWEGDFTPLQIDLRTVALRRVDGTPVMFADRVGVHLSPRALLRGKVGLRRIKIYRPAIRIIRWETGEVTLNAENAGSAMAAVAAPDTVAAKSDAMGMLTAILADPEAAAKASSLLTDLREVSVTQAGVVFEDHRLNTVFRSRNADIALLRKRSGLFLRFGVFVDMAAGEPEGYMRGALMLAGKTTADRFIDGRVMFDHLNLARMGLTGDGVAQLSGLDAPLKGIVDFRLNGDLKPQRAALSIGAGKGSINALDLYKKSVPVEHVFAHAQFDFTRMTGEVANVDIKFANRSTITAGARMEETDAEGADANTRRITIEAEARAVPIDDLKTYWPDSLTPDPRDWVTQHLSKGIASKATVAAVLDYHLPHAEGVAPVSIVDIGGKIDFSGIKVDYFPPLLPATEAKGVATFDDKSFNIDISGGKLDDMTVIKSAIRITDLDKQDAVTNAYIDIDVDLTGPLKTALLVLDSDNLKFPSSLGIDPKTVEGQSDVNVRFFFPLNKNLKVEEVKVTAKAKAREIRLPSVVAGLNISGGPMEINVDNGELNVKGSGKISSSAVDFDWKKSFNPRSTYDMQLKARARLDDQTLKGFGLPSEIAFSGAVPADVSYTLDHKGRGRLNLRGMLEGNGLGILWLGATKSAEKPGTLAAELLMENNHLVAVKGLEIKSEDMQIAGDLEFATVNGQAQLKRGYFPVIKSGSNDMTFRIEPFGEGYDMAIGGTQMDASAYFPEEDPVNSNEAAAKPAKPLKLSILNKKLLTGQERYIENVRLQAEINKWQRLERLDLAADAGGKPLELKYLPEGIGHRLTLSAQNAGAALSALGLTRSIRGGQLNINASTLPNTGPRDLNGVAVLQNFGLKDAPVIAKLLNAMSLEGIQSLLKGEGLQFKKARVDFAWTDKGQPQQFENIRHLRLRNGQTSGSSLGLTFEGAIDNWNNIYDLNGTIIPVSDLNKLLNNVPLIGGVLTAGGEGVIGATYKIKGPKSKPETSVNPLSALAPGILRKIFFD